MKEKDAKKLREELKRLWEEKRRIKEEITKRTGELLYKETDKSWGFEFDSSSAHGLQGLIRDSLMPKELDDLLNESRFGVKKWRDKKRFRIKMLVILLERRGRG